MTLQGDKVSRAIVLWTGWDHLQSPGRDDSRVADVFGDDEAKRLIPLVHEAEEQFYESDARHSAKDPAAMGEAAAAEFRSKRRDLTDEAVRALAWCYTFDFK